MPRPPVPSRLGLGRDNYVVSEPQSQGLGSSGIEYRIKKTVSSNMLA